MRKFFTHKLLVSCLALVLMLPNVWAQHISPTAGQQPVKVLQRTFAQQESLPFNESLAPFYHGVASGDPLSNAVIIWTRITTQQTGNLAVNWFMATDPTMSNVVAQGTTTTNANADYTVKVDVTGLSPATTYYFYFEYNDQASIVGRTRTTPGSTADVLKFAVVSCSNYEGGYFNAYGRIADRSDLDAVIHLGDYIYEYGPGVYGVDDSLRQHTPENEILTLADYRTRYSLYRLDSNLMRLHQQHPMISVWDDHESANDAYKDGAENHDEATEGSWEDRKAISKQVYFEWMPIRDQESGTIYRTINYGSLVDLIMIDTRLEGRDEQILDVTNPALYAPTRTLLGNTQREWLKDQIAASQAQWKVIGNQVIFSEFNVGWAGIALGASADSLESIFLDIWDGYPAERDSLIMFMQDYNDIIWLTGDFHSSFAFDIARRPSVFSTYNPATGAGAVAVEFATPSISSANFDENTDAQTSAGLEFQINQPLAAPGTPFDGVNPNPHMKYVDLDRHGYYVLDLRADSAQANYYFVDDILNPSTGEGFFGGFATQTGQNHLQGSNNESPAKENAPALAPNGPFQLTGLSADELADLVVFSMYPNPTKNRLYVHYALERGQQVTIAMYNLAGTKVLDVVNEQQNAKNYTLTINTESLPPGNYMLRFTNEQGTLARRIVVE